MSVVSLTRCEKYDQQLVDEAVAKACKEAGMPDVQGKKVLLKPNILSDSKEEKNITTHSSVVRAMVRHLKACGAKEVLIGDSPGLQGANFLPKACGINAVCTEEGARWVDFTKNPKTTPIPFTGNKKLPLASILGEVDLVFSLPKFKTHQLMYTTGAVKNLFGLVPNLHKSPCHVQFPTRELFASLLVGIYSVVKPDFALMDGIIGMEGPGPANGVSKHVGLILASRDAIALDYAMATIMGYEPLSIPVIKEGLRRNLGSKPTSYPGLDANNLVIPDYKRIRQQKKTSFLNALIIPLLFSPFIKNKVKKDRKPPVFLPEPCIQCKKCIAICPVSALKLEDKRIVIDTKVCIRCYCCHEVCPANAIEIDEPNTAS